LEEPHEIDLEERPQRRREWSGAVRSLVLPLGLLAVIVGGLWYWDSRGEGSGIDNAYGVVELPAERNPTGQKAVAEIGRVGPDFELEDVRGGTLRLSDLQGGPVLLNFWASWCLPCRDEMPLLVAASADHEGGGLTIVGLNLQETNGNVLSFADDYGVTFPVVIDRDGEVAGVWKLDGPWDGIPTSYFIDATGVIRSVVYGPLSERTLRENLETILPEGEA
jgi:peroxiredoxin